MPSCLSPLWKMCWQMCNHRRSKSGESASTRCRRPRTACCRFLVPLRCSWRSVAFQTPTEPPQRHSRPGREQFDATRQRRRTGGDGSDNRKNEVDASFGQAECQESTGNLTASGTDVPFGRHGCSLAHDERRRWACSGSVHAFVGLVILPALAFSPVALGVSGTARRLWCGSWCSSPFGFLALSVKFSAGCSAPLARISRVGLVALSPGEALTRLLGLPLRTLPSCSSVRRLLVVSCRSSSCATSPSLGR